MPKGTDNINSIHNGEEDYNYLCLLLCDGAGLGLALGMLLVPLLLCPPP